MRRSPFRKRSSGVLLLAVLAAGRGLALEPRHFDVPLEVPDDGGPPLVEVRINGKGPFRFAVDSGGQGQARVDRAVAERLGLPVVGEARGSDGMGGAATTMSSVRVDTLEVGGAAFTGVTALVRDYSRDGSPGPDGILCYELFADGLLTLDYPAGRLTFGSGSLPPVNGEDVLALSAGRPIPQVALTVGGQSVPADLDSGSMGGFTLPASLAGRIALLQPPAEVGRVRTVSQEVPVLEARSTETVHLGRFLFTQPLLELIAGLPQANVGSRVLRNFAVTFDARGRRVRLARGSREPIATTAPARNPRTAGRAAVPSEAASAPRLPEELAAYPGKYGIRTILARDGRLYLQRDGGPALEMVAAGPDAFTLARVPAARIEFERDAKGTVVALRVLNPRGEFETTRREL